MSQICIIVSYDLWKKNGHGHVCGMVLDVARAKIPGSGSGSGSGSESSTQVIQSKAKADLWVRWEGGGTLLLTILSTVNLPL